MNTTSAQQNISVNAHDIFLINEIKRLISTFYEIFMILIFLWKSRLLNQFTLNIKQFWICSVVNRLGLWIWSVVNRLWYNVSSVVNRLGLWIWSVVNRLGYNVSSVVNRLGLWIWSVINTEQIGILNLFYGEQIGLLNLLWFVQIGIMNLFFVVNRLGFWICWGWTDRILNLLWWTDWDSEFIVVNRLGIFFVVNRLGFWIFYDEQMWFWICCGEQIGILNLFCGEQNRIWNLYLLCGEQNGILNLSRERRNGDLDPSCKKRTRIRYTLSIIKNWPRFIIHALQSMNPTPDSEWVLQNIAPDLDSGFGWKKHMNLVLFSRGFFWKTDPDLNSGSVL